MKIKKKRILIAYVISDVKELISPENMDIIIKGTELKHLSRKETTYEIMTEARKVSMGLGFGYEVFKNGVSLWVLPASPMGLTVDPKSTIIKEYSKEEYTEFEKTLDAYPDLEL